MNEDVPVTAKPLNLFRPVWADPGFIMSINDYRTTDIVGTSAGSTRIATNNPKRWALGFAMTPGFMASVYVGPWSDVQNFGIKLPSDGSIFWVYLFQHGPMVTAEWYATQFNLSSMRVIEVEVG